MSAQIDTVYEHARTPPPFWPYSLTHHLLWEGLHTCLAALESCMGVHVFPVASRPLHSSSNNSNHTSCSSVRGG